MEQYLLEELAATAEKLAAGSGPLACGLVALAAGLPQLAGFGEMEAAAAAGGRELLRGVLQLALDVQAAAEPRLAEVAGADGIVRRRAEPGHGRTVTTVLGDVRVTRIAYRAGVKGAASLFPRDALLSLPPRSYSWELQRLAVMFARDVSYARAGEFLAAVTGARIGTRQLQEIVLAASADAEAFARHPGLDAEPGQDPGQDPEEGQAGGDGGLMPLVISADGKGVAMRPEARRAASVAPGDRVRRSGHRAGTGEKGHKRMAETAVVFDVRVPDEPRTPEQVMTPRPGSSSKTPRAVNCWYACGITAGRGPVMAMGFEEADRRDPLHRRPWIALVDGDLCQLGVIEREAAARGIPVTVLIDFIHVLEYLWKAGWCFHPPRDPATEAWVTAQGEDILHGRVPQVITRIQDLAALHPPRPGSEHAKNIRKTLHYLHAKQDYLQAYPAALAAGWPIATGVIEGACRHLVQDRMGITGARWGLDGAQAILWLRAIHATGSTDAYWDWHLQQEHHRNHTSRYATSLTLAA